MIMDESRESTPWLALRVHVPIACFRDAYSREYAQTYPFAPPSTVYGMLLSMVGEVNRLRHQGAKLVVGRLVAAPVSRVLRTTYRYKNTKDVTAGKNRSPDWHELLTDVRVVAWLADGEKEPAAGEEGTLKARVERALDDPGKVRRFGGLSLGESTHLVDGVWRLVQRPIGRDDKQESLEVLKPDERGIFTLPVWPNHVGSAGTRWGQFDVIEERPDWNPGEEDWTRIEPL